MNDQSDHVLQIFIREGAEQLEALDALLLQLEATPDNAEVIEQIMRVAHSFKGAAGTAEMTGCADLAHQLEEVVELLQHEELSPSAQTFDTLFDALDLLKTTLEDLGEGKGETDELASMAARLQQRAAADCAERPEGAKEPSSLQFDLGEYDEVRIKAARQQGKELHRLELWPVEEGDPQWCRGLLSVLRQLGDVIATSPREVVIDNRGVDERLAVLFASHKPLHAIQARLGTLAIDRLEAHEFGAGAAESAPATRSRGKRLKPFVKVELDRVDHLVDMIGELVIVEAMVDNSPELKHLASRRLRNQLTQMTKIIRDLQDAGMRMRMVPVQGLFQMAARTVRDASRKSEKAIQLIDAGGGAEMDRSMVERLGDPLVHLIRNAVDHGVEPAKEREKIGKPSTATIKLSAFHQGGNIVIEVSDDGRGLDKESILSHALSKGLVKQTGTLSDSEIYNLIFTPGFSTVERVTEISGRGVGMDVVQRSVEALRGRVVVHSEPGQGTTFRLILPLTLAIIDGMLVKCGEEQYIVPTLSIVESIQPSKQMLVRQGGSKEYLHLREELLPMARLGRLFEISSAEDDPTKALAVVVETLGRRIALLVDDVVDQQQVVIKTINGELSGTRMLSGAAILPTGRVGLILNVDEIGAVVERGRRPAVVLRDASFAAANQESKEADAPNEVTA